MRLTNWYLVFLISVKTFFTQAQLTTSVYEFFSTQNGLKSNNILAIQKDIQGYIWIASAEGVTRYDGHNFIHFDSRNTVGFFQDNLVNQIIKKNNDLLLVSKTNGLIKLNTSTLNFERVLNKGVSSIDFAHDTTMLLFSDNELVLKVANGKTISRKLNSSKSGTAILYNGHVYLCLSGGRVQRLESKSLKTEKSYDSHTLSLGGRLMKTKKYGIVFHTGKKVYRLINDSLVPFTAVNNLGGDITFVGEDHKYELITVVNSNQPYLKKGKEIIKAHINNPYNSEMRFLFSINEYSAFIGSNQGVIQLRVIPKLVSQLDDNLVDNKDAIKVRRAIYENNSGGLILTGYPALTFLNSSPYISSPDKNISVFDIEKFRDKLYCATDGSGLWNVNEDGSEWKQILSSKIDIDDRLYTICSYNNDNFLVGGDGKLIMFNVNEQTSCLLNKDKNIVFYKVIKHPDLELFAAATSKGLLFFELSGKFPVMVVRSRPFRYECKDLLFHANGRTVWIATNNGVRVFDSKSLKEIYHYNDETEITHPMVTSLLLDEDHRVWASTFSGVTVFGENNYLLTKKNGIKNIEYNYNSSIMLNNGDIVFGGLNTFDIFHPKALNEGVFKSEFIISGFELIRESNSSIFFPLNLRVNIELDFNPEKEDLKIFLSNFDYNYSKMYRYFYKLNDSPWIEIKDGAFILVSNVSHGKHILRVKMLDPYGVEKIQKQIFLNAKIEFYRHPYFIFAILFLLFILTLISYLFLRKSLKIETMTKQRIAMDLHDETGTILTRLLFLANRKDSHQNDLENIKQGLNDALFSLRSFLDSLSRKNLRFFDLQDELKENIKRTVSQIQIELDFKFEIAPDSLIRSELYRDVKLCIYELISNCLKYSGARNMSILVEITDTEIVIRSTDDGVLERLLDLRNGGYGINNIQKRVSRHQGNVQIYVNEPSGLRTEIRFKR